MRNFMLMHDVWNWYIRTIRYMPALLAGLLTLYILVLLGLLVTLVIGHPIFFLCVGLVGLTAYGLGYVLKKLIQHHRP